MTPLSGACSGAGCGAGHDLQLLRTHRSRGQDQTLGAGCIIGSGTVSNYDRSRGSSCLAEQRMLEIIESGQATTPLLRFW